jgi:UPF0716 family protein affecting phage T7 exclusion
MNEKNLIKICTLITILGILLMIPFTSNFFEKRTINEMMANTGERGRIFGRVDYVISENPSIFILTDGNKSKVFSPNFIKIKKNDFVTIYGETKLYRGEKEITAYHVVIE